MNVPVDKRRGSIRRPVCLAVVLAVLAPGWLCAAPATQILVLHSYTQEYPWTWRQHVGFMQTIAADAQVDATVSTEYLDTKRRAYDATYAGEMARHLQLKYAGCTPAAIYVTDDNALLLARDYLARVFPGTPVFFSGVNDYGVRTNLNAALFTGVFERKEVAPNIAWLLQMDKDANDLVFLGDDSNTAQAIEREARQDLAASRLRATFITETNVEQAVARLRDLPGKYLFLTTVGGMTDAQGQVLPLRTILQRLARAGRIVVSMEDAYITEGILGGYVTSGRQQGVQAARLVLAYLHGTPVSALPPLLKSPNVLVFDDRVLQQYGLTLPAQLRAQARLLHPHLDFYVYHRTLILGSLLSLAVLLLVVVTVALLILLRKNREVGRARTILQASEQSYRNQFANNSTVMLLIDPADGAIIDANAAALRFYGYARGQLLAMHITALNTLPAAEVRAAMTAAMEGRNQSFEFQHRLADSSLRDVAVSSSNIQSGGRTVLHTIIQDVTERRRAALAVQQGAQRAHQQRSAIARLAVDDALASGDVPTVMRRLTEAAVAAIQIERASVWLLSEDQATLRCSTLFEATPHTHSAGAILNSADYPRYFAAIRAESRICAGDARTDPRTSEFTAGYLVPLGITAMLDAGIQMEGVLAGVVCFEHVGAPRAWHADEEAFATTIAALVAQTLANAKRKQAEAALQENRRQLTDIIEFLPDATLAIDRDKRVIIWNKAIEKMTGIPAAAMLGQGAHAYSIPFYGEARPQLMDLIFEEHAALAARYDHITRVGDALVAEMFCSALYHNQGAWLSAKATPLYDQAGTIIGAIESIRDITGRKQAEAQLQRATARLALATRAGGVGIWDYDTASRRLTWDDQMFCLYGITPDQFNGTHAAWQARLHPDDVAHEDAKVQLALRGEKDYDTEFRVVWPDGSIHNIRALALVQRGAAGQPLHMIGTNWDVTAQKQAVMALREREANFRTFFESITDMIIVGTPDGQLLFTNTAVTRTLGYGADALATMHLLDVYPADTRPQARKIFDAMLKGGQESCPLPLACKDGRLVPVETRVWLGQWNGTDCIFGIAKNLTAEQEAQQRFEHLFRNNPSLMTLSSSPGRRFADVNDAVLKVLGYAREEIIGKTAAEIGLFPHLAQEAAVAHKLKMEGRVADFELQLRRKDGVLLDSLFSVELISSHGQQYFLAVMTDITARKRAEVELQKMQKLQSVGTLAGGIAHDFNNILTGLFGNISLAKDELAKEHPSYQLLAESEKSMNRAARLTQQLLTFAKGNTPVKEAVSLRELIEDVVRFDLAGSQAKLMYHQADNLWRAQVDKGQIQQVISNLTINARQAMPNGGHLHISLENAAIPADMAGLQPGNYVKITVRDEGAGIAPKHLDQIFDPYFTTKPDGIGLGLATTYSIINKHGGHIGVVSEPGIGTTFTLYLPVSETLPRAETKAPVVVCRPPARHAKILMMDDEDMICGIVVKVLTRDGLSVATAPGGQQALAMYQQALQAGAPFDVVIMDLTIPGGMGGEETIKNLLAMDPQARAIVSSGYADDPVMANYADYGFKGVAAKPYTVCELREVLRQVLQT